MTLNEFFSLCFAAILAENVVFSQLFGVDAFGRSSGGIFSVCAAMLPVMAFSSLAGSIINSYVLKPLGFEQLQVFVFTGLAALFAVLTELVYNKLTKKDADIMPLVTVNCAVLGVMLNTVQSEYTVLGSVVLGVASALGFMLAVLVFRSVTQRLLLSSASSSFEGAPLTLLAIGLVVMVFSSFADVDLGNTIMAPFKLV